MKIQTTFLIIFLVISGFIGVLGGVVLYEFNVIVEPISNEIPKTLETLTASSELDNHAQNIRYYDEVLTQSARNFAFTGNPIWEERYFQTVILLDKEIQHAISDGDSVDAAFFDNIDFANQKLIELETRSFELVNSGNSQDAVNILESNEYQNYKQIYTQGLQNFAERHDLSYEDAIMSTSKILEDVNKTTVSKLEFGTNLIILIVSIVIVISFTFGILFAKRTVSPLTYLNKAAKEISKGNLNVEIPEKGSDENKELSKSFNLMTQSLQKTIKLEKKLAITEAKLKTERFTAIGEVSSRIAHDLKNPLTAIKAELELLQHFNRQNFDDKSKKRIRVIEDSLDMMYEQIEGMMNFVRATNLEITSSTVSNLMNSVIQTVIKPENIKINLPKHDFTLKIDVKKFEAVMMNLINNSIQAIGKDQGEISIIFEETEKQIIINIVDSGEGIPKDSLEKIFEPLYTTKYTGTGLGLASCKNIVEQHGGIITVQNDPTTFTILLPRNNEKTQDKVMQIS